MVIVVVMAADVGVMMVAGSVGPAGRVVVPTWFARLGRTADRKSDRQCHYSCYAAKHDASPQCPLFPPSINAISRHHRDNFLHRLNDL